LILSFVPLIFLTFPRLSLLLRRKIERIFTLYYFAPRVLKAVVLLPTWNGLLVSIEGNQWQRQIGASSSWPRLSGLALALSQTFPGRRRAPSSLPRIDQNRERANRRQQLNEGFAR
jgi:hypothetical protein